MRRRINFLDRLKTGFRNIFMSADEKRKREKEKYFATQGKLVERSKISSETWSPNELREFQKTATKEIISAEEQGDAKKVRAIEGEIERREMKIPSAELSPEARFAKRMAGKTLILARTAQTRGRIEVAYNLFMKAASEFDKAGDPRKAGELRAEALKMMRRKVA